MVRHFLKSPAYVQATLEQCRYFHVPAGNLPRDSTVFGADLFYARHLRKQNFVLWCSLTEKPDLGGELTISCRSPIAVLNRFHSTQARRPTTVVC